MRVKNSQIETQALLITLFTLLLALASLLVVDVNGDMGMTSESNAKRILRPKRGWWRRRRRSGETNRENTVRQQREDACVRGCWTAWSSWSACSVPCGSSGTKVSQRAHNIPASCIAVINAKGCPGDATKSTACNTNVCKNGVNLASSCSCKPGFSGKCCQHAITCRSPGTLTHGSTTAPGISFPFGHTITFICDEGYNLAGSAMSTCGGTGVWSSGLPTCNVVSCPDPGSPAQGIRTGNILTFGQEVRFSCVEGYELQGSASSLCQATGIWSNPMPSCQIIQCDAPPKPDNGDISPIISANYQTEASASCHSGYYLTGSATRVCGGNKLWDGTDPSCTRIMCQKLSQLTDGSIAYSEVENTQGFPHSTKAQFSCNSGHRLLGSSDSECAGDGPRGEWSNQLPTCKVVSCGDPGTSTSGSRTSSSFVYADIVNFRCMPGYLLEGAATITCSADGTWTAPSPLCKSCAKNFYKVGENTLTSCTQCPPNSQTTAVASKQKTNCLCDLAYKGPAGGPCQVRQCTALPAPQFGSIVSCAREYNQACVFACNSGYVRESGDAERRCNLQEQWSGSQPRCKACPRNTYKNEQENRCDACPEHSSTVSDASVRSDCKCDSGWNGLPGQECSDIDECASSNAGCQQTCQNAPGTFRCLCDRPGFEVDSLDHKKCLAENECEDLAPPDNGGLLCTLEQSTSIKRCQLKCNPGFEPFDTNNIFDMCGPDQWTWTTEGERPCMNMGLPPMEQDTSTAYWVENCEELTLEELNEAKSQFMTEMRGSLVCLTCNIEDIGATCGTVTEDGDYGFGGGDHGDFEDFGDYDFGGFKRRRKRSTKREALIIRVKLIEGGKPLSESICIPRCLDPFKEYTNSSCVTTCVSEEIAADRRRLQQRTGDIGRVLADPKWCEKTMKLGNGKELKPSCIVKVRQINSNCTSGMILRENSQFCQLCPAGSMIVKNRCVLCEEGSIQLKPGQKTCSRCPKTTPFTNKARTQCFGYSCDGLNPCKAGNMPKFYFPHGNPGNFIQCDTFGGCYERQCPPGLVFNGKISGCDRPQA